MNGGLIRMLLHVPPVQCCCLPWMLQCSCVRSVVDLGGRGDGWDHLFWLQTAAPSNYIQNETAFWIAHTRSSITISHWFPKHSSPLPTWLRKQWRLGDDGLCILQGVENSGPMTVMWTIIPSSSSQSTFLFIYPCSTHSPKTIIYWRHLRKSIL